MHLGIDFGTSGCRACVIDSSNKVVYHYAVPLKNPISEGDLIQQKASVWWQGLTDLLNHLTNNFNSKLIQRIAINGTSSSVLACSINGDPLTPALMYNDASSNDYLSIIKQISPADHLVNSNTSGLAKIFNFKQQFKDETILVLNQADWISNKLCSTWGYTDYHNALKMGYDCFSMSWPSWLTQPLNKVKLPKVLEPGEVIAPIAPPFLKKWGFNDQTLVCAGTTDSTSAFIATGVCTSDTAVTSLGSTMVLKVISNKPLDKLKYGVYSHKLGNYWLSGGASNSGGSVLKQFFNVDQLSLLSKQINTKVRSKYNYYPLPHKGERFPFNDPEKVPVLTPKPEAESEFLKAIFEGTAEIEKKGYERLMELGAEYPNQIMSSGGGAKNKEWSQIRENICRCKVSAAKHQEACYGAALLAKYGLSKYK